MSSYQPPEEDDSTSSHDPGQKEKEITDSREFAETISELDRIDYVLLGVLSSIFAGILTTILVLQFVPEYAETAERIVEQFLELFTQLIGFSIL